MIAVVVEDEKPAARRLCRMLEKMEVSVAQTLHSVENAVDWFQKNPPPDIIFLDIQLSDGLSFEIFDKAQLDCPVIFTTAYDAYALQAFKLNSVDYLLKPIEEEALLVAVQKYRNLKANYSGGSAEQRPEFDMQEIKRLLKPEEGFKKRFTVSVGQHIKLVDIEDLECIYSENKGTYLFTKDQRSYLIDTPLDALEKELSPVEFFRVNRKFIISIKALKDIVAYSNSRLKLKLRGYSDDEIIVARERVKDFKSWLE